VEYADGRPWPAAAAEAFAANGYSADRIYVNVQALSGAPANNAVYQALLNIGDTVMGLNLLHGGHLSHGSSVNRSGKWFKAVHYAVDEKEKLDYDKIREQALEAKPKLIIAGYSSYSWIPDWKKFREIADEVGAYFLADISHIGGLVAAGVVPAGAAHVVMSTTHKSPTPAAVLLQPIWRSQKIDKAVFLVSRADPMSMCLPGWRSPSNWHRPNSSRNYNPKPLRTRKRWRTNSSSADYESRSVAQTATSSTWM
jgi:glycine hydroxymethyltransferase